MQAIEQSAHVYVGRLMSPSEVRLATAHQPALSEAVKSRWCLCGDIPASLWDLLQSSDMHAVGHRISAFTTEDHTAYAILTVQVDDAQVRFLFPLCDRRAAAFLEDAGTHGCWFSLGQENGRLTMLKSFRVSPKDIRPLAELAKVSRRLSAEGTLLELHLAARASMRPGLVPSVFMEMPVQRVVLNVILPQLTAEADEREDQAAIADELEGDNGGSV